MTKDELLKKCEELGIKANKNMKNDLLEGLIAKHEEAAKADAPSVGEENPETETGSPEIDSGDMDDVKDSSLDDSGEDFGTANLDEDKSSDEEPEAPARVEEEKVMIIGLKNFTTNCGVDVRREMRCLISASECERLLRDPRRMIKRA